MLHKLFSPANIHIDSYIIDTDPKTSLFTHYYNIHITNRTLVYWLFGYSILPLSQHNIHTITLANKHILQFPILIHQIILIDAPINTLSISLSFRIFQQLWWTVYRTHLFAILLLDTINYGIPPSITQGSYLSYNRHTNDYAISTCHTNTLRIILIYITTSRNTHTTNYIGSS